MARPANGRCPASPAWGSHSCTAHPHRGRDRRDALTQTDQGGTHDPIQGSEPLTKFLPEKYSRATQFVQFGRHTRIAINGVISDFIPNPTFERVLEHPPIPQPVEDLGPGAMASPVASLAPIRHDTFLGGE
ncbi:MAG: hypothetical protein QOK33_5954 [Mycobacterium sp.]|nr:hypothetical protein [Mycobacterium sp.]